MEVGSHGRFDGEGVLPGPGKKSAEWLPAILNSRTGTSWGSAFGTALATTHPIASVLVAFAVGQQAEADGCMARAASVRGEGPANPP